MQDLDEVALHRHDLEDVLAGRSRFVERRGLDAVRRHHRTDGLAVAGMGIGHQRPFHRLRLA